MNAIRTAFPNLGGTPAKKRGRPVATNGATRTRPQISAKEETPAARKRKLQPQPVPTLTATILENRSRVSSVWSAMPEKMLTFAAGTPSDLLARAFLPP